MRPSLLIAILLSVVLLGAAAGCTPLAVATKMPLTAPPTVQDGVVLDVLYVRFPPNDPQMNETVWQEIDELHLPADVRRRLEANGLRVGLISGPLPIALEERLDLQEKPATDADLKPLDVDDPTTVRRRQLHVRGGKKSNILVLGERERRSELSVLLRNDDGRVEGRTYRHVLGLFAAKAFPQGNGTVTLDLVPELEHGDSQKRFVPGDGMFRVEFGPPHEVFHQLRCEMELAPGQMLAVTSLPSKPGSLGYQFFHEKDGDLNVQKMLLVRLARSTLDDRFDDSARTAAPADGAKK
jgi:hypothetical protein